MVFFPRVRQHFTAGAVKVVPKMGYQKKLRISNFLRVTVVDVVFIDLKLTFLEIPDQNIWLS